MTTTIQIRVDQKMKKDVKKLFETLGTDISGATKMFFAQAIRTKSIPFPMRTVNGFTSEYETEILKEVAWAKKHAKRFHSVEELMKDLRK